MQSREDLHGILERTLSRGWSEQRGREVTVRFGPATGQAWQYLPLLSAYVHPDVADAPRRWLRDAFRNTPVRRRRVPQWILGTAMTLGPVLRRVGRPAFRVEPDLPDARHLLVLPGNQRVRVFDFRRGTCRVLLKDGFAPTTMETEIRVRGDGATGPFPPIEDHGADASWFEEPIVDGWSLPRCPLHLDRIGLAREALRLVTAWSEEEASTGSAAERAAEAADRAVHLLERARARFGDLPAVDGWIEALAGAAGRPRTLPRARTHGDLQPGNVLVRRADRGVLLIDWEHAAVRSRWYDLLVYGLEARHEAGLARRLRAFVEGGVSVFGLPEDADDPAWRRATLAAFLLDDVIFRLGEALAGPWERLPDGPRAWLDEVAAFGPRLDGLLREGP